MSSTTNSLSSWLVVNGRYDSRAVNLPENDPPGHRRVHWDELLQWIRNYGGCAVETLAEVNASLDGSKEVIVIAGHSRWLDDDQGAALQGRDSGRIIPSALAALDGCRLLWLSTCFGERWLNHGLWSKLPAGAIVVTSGESDRVYGSGDAGLKDFARQWLDAVARPWENNEFSERVSRALAEISHHEPQNLRMVRKASAEQSLADAWDALSAG